MIVRLSLALLVTLGSIALAWMILGLTSARAAGVIETPTQATPWAVAFDKSSHVWVAEPGCDAEPNCTSTFPSYIGQYNRTNGALVKNFKEPTGFSSPAFLRVDKPGNISFSHPTTHAIGRLTPVTIPGLPARPQRNVPTPTPPPHPYHPPTNTRMRTTTTLMPPYAPAPWPPRESSPPHAQQRRMSPVLE